MNVSLPPSALQPEPPMQESRPGLFARLTAVLMGRAVTVALAVLALCLGVGTFFALARGTPIGITAGVGAGLVLANLSVLLILGALLAGRLTRVWMERRRGAAGARLHVRLVMLFGGIAVAPTIVVAIFAVVFFHVGIQAWFNDPVREALTESLQASRGYLEEHRDNIRSVALEMANDLSNAGRFLAIDPNAFADILATQTALRGLTEAIIFEPVTNQIIARAGLFAGLGVEAPPQWATERARAGDTAVLDTDDGTRARGDQAAVQSRHHAADRPPGRSADPRSHGHDRFLSIAWYDAMDKNRSW